MADSTLLDHLSQVERHVSMGLNIIERQRKLIRNLEQRGVETRAACNLLVQFDNLQVLHELDRERLLGELDRRLSKAEARFITVR
jgi:hypothetical protein